MLQSLHQNYERTQTQTISRLKSSSKPSSDFTLQSSGTPTQTEWVILDKYSDDDIRHIKNQSGWNVSQQKERWDGWTCSAWTEDPWSLSGDKEPDVLSNDGTFSNTSTTCVDGETLSTWTMGGTPYVVGSFISPFYTPSTPTSPIFAMFTECTIGALSYDRTTD